MQIISSFIAWSSRQEEKPHFHEERLRAITGNKCQAQCSRRRMDGHAANWYNAKFMSSSLQLIRPLNCLKLAGSREANVTLYRVHEGLHGLAKTKMLSQIPLKLVDNKKGQGEVNSENNKLVIIKLRKVQAPWAERWPIHSILQLRPSMFLLSGSHANRWRAKFSIAITYLCSSQIVQFPKLSERKVKLYRCAIFTRKSVQFSVGKDKQASGLAN